MSRAGSYGFRFESVADLERDRAARRERFNRGEVHTLEKDVLAACLEFCQRHPAIAWAARANVGAGYLIRYAKFQELVAAGHLKESDARFVRYGLKNGGDITGMFRGTGRRLEVETKSDTGRVKDDQAAFGQAVNGGGGLWVIARSIDDVADALK